MMKNMKSIKNLLVWVVISIILVSCATAPKKTAAKPVLIEHPERCFWEIKGDTGSVYVLGTIHVADKTFFPLEENVLKAFDNADRLVSELGGIAEMQALVGAMQETILRNMNTDPAKHLTRFLTEKELNLLYSKLGEETVKPLCMFNPWILNIALAEVLWHEVGLNRDEGIDVYLMGRAASKKIEALDTMEQQMEILTKGTFEDQIAMLKDSIQAVQDQDGAVKELKELRRLYLNNNREGLTSLLLTLLEVPESFSEEKKQAFIDTLLTDRNHIWAQKFHTYLQQGGNTFVFAGVAHFLGGSSVFEIMKQEGFLEIRK